MIHFIKVAGGTLNDETDPATLTLRSTSQLVVVRRARPG